ncbi:hypothetical protein GCM10022222_31110 [Amycolatopsis ultiminotia]|uniref:Uncharacterized protein n=1 Tax=Amycolatopsis ultiminotia TaxID=543629 RepID=A0ABP6W692_9PSEU
MSPSSATDPVNATSASWPHAVTKSPANDQVKALIPRRLVSSARSTRPELSWLCGVIACRIPCHRRAIRLPGWS